MKSVKNPAVLLGVVIYAASIAVGLSYNDMFDSVTEEPKMELNSEIKVQEPALSEQVSVLAKKEDFLSEDEVNKLTGLSMIVMKHYNVSPQLASTIVVQSNIEAKKQNLPTTLILAVMAQESSFRPQVVSHNDHGLMQVNAFYHAGLIARIGGKAKLLEPKNNIQVGVAILAANYRQAGTYWKALRKYNGEGKSNSYPDDVLAKMYIFEKRLAEM